MATTTTQILFNSPALHALKRDQLVKLCKIHSIKANGKNSELIDRLKQRALELPPEAQYSPEDEDDPMDEDEDAQDIPGGMPMDEDEPAPAPMANANGADFDMQDVVLTSRFSIPRPSEQWEVVMEDIQEADETMGTASSKNSLKTVSNGEFGTHMSKSSVSSSIKALASSLGIKRITSKANYQTPDSDNTDPESNTNPNAKMPTFSPGKLLSIRARDSLAEHAVPYADIPPAESLPDTDHFKFSTPDASILGLDDDDAPTDDDAKSVARSSVRVTGLGGGRSTIRLVSHPAAAKKPQDEYAYMSPPRLPVVQTEFDIVAGTPGTVRSFGVWPASPRSRTTTMTTMGGGGADGEGRLYPKLPLDEDDEDGMPGGIGAGTRASPAKSLASPAKRKTTNTPGPVDEPDMFSPFKPRAAAPTATTSTAGHTPARTAGPRRAPPPPFLFGSPLPRRPTTATTIVTIPKGKDRDKDEENVKEKPGGDGEADGDGDGEAGVSNAAFDGIAKSILEEMHRRVAESNKDKDKPPSTSSSALPAQPLFAFAPTTAGRVVGKEEQDRFGKAHAAEFAKMDSIANHYAARRPPKRKSDALGGRPSAAGQRRRSSAAGARVISAGARKKMGVPGGFGADEDEDDGESAEEELGKEREREEREGEEEEDAGARRSSKRIRITEGWDVHRAGQRVSLAPPLPPAEEEKKAREREAVKRELDAAKMRRRSSRGRPSIGAPPAKAKSRFGFFGAAKSLVRNVWNMGAGSKAKPAAAAAAANAPPSSIPVPKASQAPAAIEKKAEKAKADATAAAASKASGSVPASASNTSKASGSQPNKLLKPPPKNAGTTNSTKSTSSRSRSPIPPFNAPPPPSGTVKSTATTASRPSSIVGTARSRVSSTSTSTSTGAGTAASRLTGRSSAVSSMGTRSSVTSATTAVSSIGTRRSMASTNTLASTSSSSRAETRSPAETKDQPSLRKRTSSLHAPTASSLAKTNTASRQSSSGRTSGLPPVAEAPKGPPPKRASAAASSSKAALLSRSGSPKLASSPRPTRIFSQPLTNFASPSPAHQQPSLAAAAASIMSSSPTSTPTTAAATTTTSSPSKIPRPTALPPKPKQLVARKPRISRSKVIAKLGAQRAAAAQGLGSPQGTTRTRSSMGAARRSFGGVKAAGARASAGSEMMRSAVKKRARQSEYVRRRSKATENENASVAGDD